MTAAFGGLLPLRAQKAFAHNTLGQADVAVSNVVGPDRLMHIDGMEVTKISKKQGISPGFICEVAAFLAAILS